MRKLASFYFLFFLLISIQLHAQNHPPYPPRAVFPINGSSVGGMSVILKWTCSDPDGDALTYNLWLKINDDGQWEQIAFNQSQNTLDIFFVPSNNKYSWRIEAFDGLSSSSSTYTFYDNILNTPPNPPTCIEPIMGSTNLFIGLLKWDCEDPDGNVLRYTIFLRKDNLDWTVLAFDYPNKSLQTNITSPGFYHWAVKASDGIAEGGRTFEFTIQYPNSPPQVSITSNILNGTKYSNFIFTANCFDNDSPTDQLVVSWDLDGDGFYETAWSLEKTITKNFPTPDHGINIQHTVNVMVKDPEGLTNTSSLIVTGIQNSENLPSAYYLSQNYPNPFNPITSISYYLPRQSRLQLKIFDLLGREIQTLINEEKPAGKYEVKFDGSALPSGVYAYTLRTGEFFQTKKLILLK